MTLPGPCSCTRSRVFMLCVHCCAATGTEEGDDPFEATRKRIERLKADGTIAEPPREPPSQGISGTLVDPVPTGEQGGGGWEQREKGRVIVLRSRCADSGHLWHADKPSAQR